MTTATIPTDPSSAPTANRTRANGRSNRLLPLAGIVAVGLVTAGHFVHGDVPAARSDLATVVQFYRGNATNVYVGSVLIGLAAFFFVIFASSLRSRLRAEAHDQSTVFGMATAGATVLAVGLTLIGSIGIALGHKPAALDPSSVQALHAVFFDLFAPIGVGTALFLVGNGLAMLRTDFVPRWLGWVAVPCGLLALVPEPVGDLGLIGLGLWIVLISVLLSGLRITR